MIDDDTKTQVTDAPAADATVADATAAADATTAAPAAKRTRSTRGSTQPAEASKPKESEVTTTSAKRRGAKSAKKAAKKSAKRAAKRVTAKSSGNGARAPRSLDATITPIGDNPFREGTDRHKQLELARKSKTVGKFVEAGGDRAYLSWFNRSKRVRVSA
jgi:hypothetical protein